MKSQKDNSQQTKPRRIDGTANSVESKAKVKTELDKTADTNNKDIALQKEIEKEKPKGTTFTIEQSSFNRGELKGRTEKEKEMNNEFADWLENVVYSPELHLKREIIDKIKELRGSLK